MRIKHTVKILLLFLLFFGLLFWLNQITTPDRVGDAPWGEYYALPDDTLDVLFVGSSKVNHTFNPVVINNALEMDAYSLSAHGIGMDESYYVLREAFKTQSPKIVALELYSAKPVAENSNDRAPLHRVYDDMRLSPNKAEAILSKVPIKESLEYFIPFTINHSRWKDLSFQDFFLLGRKAPAYTRFFGYYIVEYNVPPSEFTIPPQDYMDDTAKIMPDSGTMQTLERITALCKENGAQLVYVVSPGYGEEKFGYADMHRLVNGLTPYAEAEGIMIWDYHRLLLDGEMQYQDFTDSHHTDTLGADKVSRAFAEDVGYTFDGLLAGCTQDWDISEMAEKYTGIFEELQKGKEE